MTRAPIVPNINPMDLRSFYRHLTVHQYAAGRAVGITVRQKLKSQLCPSRSRPDCVIALLRGIFNEIQLHVDGAVDWILVVWRRFAKAQRAIESACWLH